MAKIKEENIIRSALWAAYGDAIGFPTELVSASEFKKRNSVASVSKPIAFTRRVGGMFGPDIAFPEGTYSDDTQLRLSTSRAINSAGFFDVESLAKIELPVWLNYALGAGRGSKAAAANLALRDSSWSLNFFSSASVKYWDGGGNGAAMRIQPHVWQNHDGPRHAFVSDVIRNSICTHGHPRALIGAIIHAALLYETMQSGEAIRPLDWAGLGEAMGHIGMEMLEADPELPLVWIPSWERYSKRSLRDVWLKTIDEWAQAANTAARICESESADPAKAYVSILTELSAFDPYERGSGLKTPLYASVLAWLYRNEPPEIGLAGAANVFGSDTDTIATMAGALMGVVAQTRPETPVQDEEYIKTEASRMFRAGRREPILSFEYPDLMSWSAPKAQSDAWISESKGERLAGIGSIHPFGPIYKSKKGLELVWQWAKLDFGQTVLVKRRAGQTPDLDNTNVPNQISRSSLPAQSEVRSTSKSSFAASDGQASLIPQEAQMQLVDEGVAASTSYVKSRPTNLDTLTQKCIKGGFDPEEVGNALLSQMNGPDAIERAIAFAAIIAKAKVVRSAK